LLSAGNRNSTKLAVSTKNGSVARAHVRPGQTAEVESGAAFCLSFETESTILLKRRCDLADRVPWSTRWAYYGTFRVLGRLVRELKVSLLPDAMRKMISPACCHDRQQGSILWAIGARVTRQESLQGAECGFFESSRG
jgi:hypothetical protein